MIINSSFQILSVRNALPAVSKLTQSASRNPVPFLLQQKENEMGGDKIICVFVTTEGKCQTNGKHDK